MGTQFPDDRFVTALIAQLDLQQGRLDCVTAGHPAPLLIRGGRWARTLDLEPAPPLGVGVRHEPVVTTAWLQPDDMLLLYTDGLTEARDASGRLLGIEGLSEFIEREAAAGQTTPETLRRLRQAIRTSPFPAPRRCHGVAPGVAPGRGARTRATDGAVSSADRTSGAESR